MADRPAVYQVLEFGLEAVAEGTEAANYHRRFRAVTVDFAPTAEVDQIKSTGYKWDTFTALNREWTPGSIGGDPDYNELPYFLSSIIDTATVATQGTAAAGTAFSWTYESDSDGADTFQSYSFARGDSNYDERVLGVKMTDFGLSISRQDVSLTGAWVGRRVAAGTAGIDGTALFVNDTQRPVLPSHFSVYLDDTFGNLGSTKLTRDFQIDWNIAGRHTPIWPVDSAQTSYAATVEGAGVTQTISLSLLSDETAHNFITQLRDGSNKFLRIEAVGGTTAAGTVSYTFRADFAIAPVDIYTPSVTDDLDVWTFPFTVVHDNDWGKSHAIVVYNAISTLAAEV